MWRQSALSFAVLLGITACGGASSGSNSPTPGRVISYERIQNSGGRNAWEVLQLTVPHIKFEDGGGARPTGVTGGRGRSSLVLDNTPMIVIDERKILDFGELRRMPVSAMNSIHILSSIEGTTRYGTDAANGVIVIRTRQT